MTQNVFKGPSVRVSHSDPKPGAPQPTVFIGLGGTGLKVLARLRRLIYDRFGDPDYWPILGFLGIDCDEGDLKKGGVVNSLGLPVEEPDQVNIGMTSAEVRRFQEEMDAHPIFKEWLSPGALGAGENDFTKGAGQIRSIARMLFVQGIGRIRRRLVAKCIEVGNQPSITEAEQKAGGPIDGGGVGGFKANIWIVGSLAGGTGSGTFLDCAYLAHALEGVEAPIGAVRGMLVLPDVFEVLLKDKPQQIPIVYANAYAALRELEYYNDLNNPRHWQYDWGWPGPHARLKTHPFQVCYLFSHSNGSAMSNSDSLFDLVADALAFSVMGTTLASELRGSWKNADAGAYRAGWTYRLDDTDIRDRRSIYKYERTWATRYSALGIASISLKLPELRRLAAVRLLRRIVHAENGVAPPNVTAGSPKPAAASQAVHDEFAQVFLETPNFVAILRSNALENLKKITHKVGVTADEVEGVAQGMLGDLHEINKEVGSRPKDSLHNTVRRLFQKVERLADDQLNRARIAPAMMQPHDVCSQLLWKVIGRIEHLGAAQPLEPLSNEPFQPRTTKMWQDLEVNKGWLDLFGLNERALQIIRGRFEEAFAEQIESYCKHINMALVSLYRALVRQGLQELADGKNDAVQNLLAWEGDAARGLIQVQNDIASHFADDRNLVLTTDVAAGATPGDQKEPLLDKTIDDALREKYKFPQVDDAALLRVRGYVLESLHHAMGPTTLLDAKKNNVQLTQLIDATALHILDGLPKKRSVYAWLDGQLNDIAKHLGGVSKAAIAYWPIRDGEDSFVTDTDASFLCGAVNVPNNQVLERVEADLKKIMIDGDPKWIVSKTLPSAAGASDGELVLVNERHGLTLLSLRFMDTMIDHYNAVRRDGKVADRHLDIRLINQLPDLGMMKNDIAKDEINAWDTAMKGILLGVFRWDGNRGQYFYLPENQHDEVEVGDSYVMIARWLREAENEYQRAIIDTLTNQWFEQRIATADETREAGPRQEAARELARKLFCLDLMLDLLGRHCFPPDKVGGATRFLPEHTMTLRLRKLMVQKNLDTLGRICPTIADELKGSALPKEAARGLHRVVQFVGPRPVDREGQPMARQQIAAADRKHRVLQLPRKGQGNPDDVLKEAFNLNWFPDAVTERQLENLFPNLVDEDIVLGDIDPARLTVT